MRTAEVDAAERRDPPGPRSSGQRVSVDDAVWPPGNPNGAVELTAPQGPRGCSLGRVTSPVTPVADTPPVPPE